VKKSSNINLIPPPKKVNILCPILLFIMETKSEERGNMKKKRMLKNGEKEVTKMYSKY